MATRSLSELCSDETKNTHLLQSRNGLFFCLKEYTLNCVLVMVQGIFIVFLLHKITQICEICDLRQGFWQLCRLRNIATSKIIQFKWSTLIFRGYSLLCVKDIPCHFFVWRSTLVRYIKLTGCNRGFRLIAPFSGFDPNDLIFMVMCAGVLKLTLLQRNSVWKNDFNININYYIMKLLWIPPTATNWGNAELIVL